MKIEELIDVLIDLSHKKENHLKEMCSLTEMQEDSIKNEDVDGLTGMIEKKRVLVEKINYIDVLFLENHNQLKKSLNISSIENMDVKEYPRLKELKLSIGNIMELLKKIDIIDGRNKEKVKIDFEKVKAELKNIKGKKKSAKITSSYQNKYIGAQGVFIDHK